MTETNTTSNLTPPTQNQTNSWFVYLLRCADNTLYCGITTNLNKRLRQHNGELAGGAKYTKVRQPCELVYSEKSDNRSEACKREAAIKKLTKTDKEALVTQA
ncbi:MAG: putative endonuclease [Thiomicrorhabdus sp.]|nr:MAG: putative endonuclease [Thiomicrorhabdus sp.]